MASSSSSSPPALGSIEEAGVGEASARSLANADAIVVRHLLVRNIIGVDNWERKKKQDIVIHLRLYFDVTAAGEHDDVRRTLDYAQVTKTVADFAEEKQYKSVEGLAEGIAQICLAQCGVPALTVRVEKPRALLNAASAGVEITRSREARTLLPFAPLPRLQQDDKGVYHAYAQGTTGVRAPSQDGPDQAAAPLPRTIVGLHSHRDGRRAASDDCIFINGLRIHTIVGVNPAEREERQDIIAYLSMWSTGRATSEHDYVARAHNYRTICHSVTRLLEASSYRTIEAMALAVARFLVTQCNLRRVTVRLDKPSALLLAQAASIEITRDRSHFVAAAGPIAPTLRPGPDTSDPPPPSLALSAGAHSLAAVSEALVTAQPTSSLLAPPPPSPLSDDGPAPRHCVYVALGSNLGDRASAISRALEVLVAETRCVVADTAFLYETPPAYVVDQPPFLNTVCKLYTSLSPQALLHELKRIEVALGREPSIRHGPRAIDLDILFYDDLEVQEADLIIPHALLHEREFVLRPLCDIAPYHEHPGLQKTVEHLLLHLKERGPIWPVLPVGPGAVWRWGERTRIMGILNITPDSFSDVGKFTDVDAAVAHALHMVASGVDLIDVGGMSSRPHAADVAPAEESARVVETIRRLRAAGITVPISVDTFRAQVARDAVAAGATFVNDISGGTRDSAMLATMAATQTPVCLMHMRGDASTMTAPDAKRYDGGVVDVVRRELEVRVAAALAAGVRRWNIIVDPGLGFAKDPAQSLELVRGLRTIVGPGTLLARFPTLAGPSRKGFVGAVVHRAVSDRAWGTAAVCAALVSEGVDILRVHDVNEMVDVVRMGDAIWRAPVPAPEGNQDKNAVT